MKNFLVSISMMLENIKGFLIAVLIIILCICTLVGVIHNLWKIKEIYEEDTTGYRNHVWVDENRMNVQVTGEGEKTIVILSDFASASPIIQYKTYVEKLAEHYKVVVVEYFGYGYSLSTKAERTCSQIAHEVKTALEQSGIGSATILANGNSSLYAYTYANLYPEAVEKLIVVDSIYPDSINETFINKYYEEQKTNAIITSYMEATGINRILSYVKPDEFGIDKMQEYGFSEEDISLYRKMIASKYYTPTMRREAKKLMENIQTLESYELPDYLPVIQILSKEYVQEFKNYKKDKFTNKDIEEYANDIITNPEIQKVVVIDGTKNLNLSNPNKVVETILNY